MSLKTERVESTKLLHVETTDETKDEIRLYGQMVDKKKAIIIPEYGK